ncbi:MAG: glycosyltransferase [Gammaproteobacteria bacterium]
MKVQTPEISVIIAVYNGGSTVGRAVDSVLAQTYPAKEVIVIDDGSTDHTPGVVRSYGSAVRYLRTENRGVAAARNSGAEIAEGNWLAFLDADDWYYPQRLEWHARIIRRHPDLDFATGDFEYRNGDDQLMGRSMEATELGRRLLGLATDGEVIMEREMFGDFVSKHFGDTHTLSVPKKLFSAVGGYPTKYQVCEDVHFLIRLCAHSGRVGVICRPMAVYRIHGQSATRSDPVHAQRQTVAALTEVRKDLVGAGRELRGGVDRALRAARLDLASALLRNGRRTAAIRAVLPLLYRTPRLRAVRDVASVARGFRSGDGGADTRTWSG